MASTKGGHLRVASGLPASIQSMSEIRFDFEWIDPLAARGPELRATWARLVIWAGSKCVSRVLDQDVKSVRDAVYLPLYPLAEWLVTHWWTLLVEVPSPERLADPNYAERHSLRAARDGFALPPASIAGEGDHIRVRWHREALPNYRVEFIEEGTAHVPVQLFRQSLTTFITAVLGRLHAEGITGTVLQEEWAALQALSKEEEEFCEVTAALGLDPFGLDESAEARIIRATEAVPSKLRRDFLFAATTDNLEKEACDVSSAYASAHDNDIVLTSILSLRNELAAYDPQPAVQPWSRGYLAAQRLREAIGIPNEPFPSFEAIAKALRVSDSSLQAALVDMPNATGVYDALVATNRRESPSFAISARHNKAAHRFHFCRGLYEFLRADDSGPWLVTKSLSDNQKQSRAFAAEFLAPAAALRKRVSGSTVSVDEVDDISQEFGVSTYVINHQFENNDIATVLPS
jgi:hypothetical protein